MLDILLIQPKVGEWDTIRSGSALPLSLLSISTLIQDKYKIKIVDQRVTSDWKNQIKNVIESNNLICVGITSMIGPQVRQALIISNFIKKIDSNLPIIWGGVQPSLIPHTFIKYKNVDIIVVGEGELTFSELVEHLHSEKDLKNIKGLIFKENGKIIETGARELLDMNTLPSIPYHLVDINNYLPKYLGEGTFYFQTSRGCPNNCIYCYNVPFNRACWRGMKAERVIEELTKIMNMYNVNHFYLIDDNFFVDMKRAKELVQLIINKKLNIHWQIQGVEIDSLVKMDNEFLLELEKSGLKRITIGLETGSPKILKLLKKRFTIKSAIEVNRKMSQYNIIIFYSIICGYPEETDRDLRQTIQLVLKILKENPNSRFSPFFACTPFPGTELFENCKSKGLVNEKLISTWINSHYTNMNAMYFDEKRNNFLNKLIFTSFFIDRIFKEYNFSKFDRIFKISLRLYRIFARFRIKYLKFNFLIEKRIFENFIRSIFKIN